MRLKRALSVLIAVSMLYSLTGCSNNAVGKKNPSNITDEVIYSENTDDGIHIFEVQETDIRMVENGQCDYQIVIPAECGSYTGRAASEFKSFFRLATGIDLSVITDESVEFQQSDRYIVFGDVSFVDKAEHGYDMNKVNSSGYVIKTVGNTVFVIGGGDAGVLNGAYELLYQLVDYRYYDADTIVYDKNVKDLNLKDFSICDAPDIEFQIAGYGGTGGGANSVAAHRLRTYTTAEVWIEGLQAHSVFRILDPELYKTEHAEWYSSDNVQLCYTAHGDEASYNTMVDTTVENLKTFIDAYPDLQNASITQNDYAVWCNCDSCRRVIEEYGGACSATQILFVNDVAEKVEQWLNTERNGRKVNIAIFAYHKTEKAPVKLVNGEYKAINDLKLRENVSIWYAPIYAAYNYSPYAAENNEVVNNFKGWSAVADSMYLWYYDVNYLEYCVPYNSFGAKSDWYKIAKQYNAKFIYNLGAWNSKEYTGFNHLKCWLNSKLGWDVNYDYQMLLDEYFTNYFGPASDTMREYFDSLESWMITQTTNTSDVLSEIAVQDYWEKSLLESWLGMIDEALKDIEALEATDPALYEVYRTHIVREGLAIRYLLVELYIDDYAKDVAASMVNDLANDLQDYSLTNVAEGTVLSKYLEDLMDKVD